MLVADFDALDVLWIALAVFLIVVGVALAAMFVRLAGTARRLTSLLSGVEERALPLIKEVSGTVERVNVQLDKADVVTTSAVDAVSAVDRGVRDVAGVLSWPVRKISSFTTGVKHGAASLRTEHDLARAYETGREAADRRAADLQEEMAENDETKSGDPSMTIANEQMNSAENVDAGVPWMELDESDVLTRARCAGRRQAQSESS